MIDTTKNVLSHCCVRPNNKLISGRVKIKKKYNESDSHWLNYEGSLKIKTFIKKICYLQWIGNSNIKNTKNVHKGLAKKFHMNICTNIF